MKVVKMLDDGIAGVEVEKYGRQLWTRCTAKTPRRPKKCQVCEEPVLKGQKVYRPQTNAGNRMDRVHSACLELSFQAAERLRLGIVSHTPEIRPGVYAVGSLTSRVEGGNPCLSSASDAASRSTSVTKESS